MRSGWRAVGYGLLLVALAAAEIWFLARLQPPWLKPEAVLSVWFVVLNELMLLFPVLFATAAMAGTEGRTVLSCGLAGSNPGIFLAGGLLAGIGALSLLMALLQAGGWAESHWRGLPVLGIALNGAAWLGASLLVGLTEEMAFRGYLQQVLSRGMGFWPAALVTSLIFGLLHITNQHESVIGIVNVCGAGLILCLGLRRTGSLWWPIGFHAGWDFSENFLFGTHDSGQACAGALLDSLPLGPAWLSGGLAGPEGSLLGLGVEVVVAAGLFIFLRPRSAPFDMDQCVPKG